MDGNSYYLNQPSFVNNTDTTTQQQQQQQQQQNSSNKTKNQQQQQQQQDMNVTANTHVDFANIFAGATAAAGGGSASNILVGGKGFPITNAFPHLNQLSIPPASQLSKRSTNVFPIAASLPSMVNINNNVQPSSNNTTDSSGQQQTTNPSGAQATGSQSQSGVVTASVNNQPRSNSIQHSSPVNIDFASQQQQQQQQQSTISKDFIQQAAAESGLMSSSSDMPTLIPTQSYNQQQSVVVTSSGGASTSGTSPDNNSSSQLKCKLQPPVHKCNSCPESFVKIQHLQDHIKAVHPDVRASASGGGGGDISVVQQATNPFTCSQCSGTFPNLYELNYHVYMIHAAKQHPVNLQQHVCGECGKGFMEGKLLIHHLKNAHGIVQQRHRTTSSAYNPASSLGVGGGSSNTLVTVNEMNMLAHMPSMASTIDMNKQFRCNSCEKRFKTASYLRQHVLAVHSKPHKCEDCGKGFGRKSDLQRHMRGVHMRERPHCCDRCGWTFAEAGNLKHHLQAVHSKEKNHICSICEKSFSISSYLKTHMLRVHGFVDTQKQNVAKAMLSASHQQQQNFLNVANLQQQQNRSSQSATATAAVGGNNATAAAAVANLQLAAATSSVTSPSNAQNSNRCFECGMVFPTHTALQTHVMSTHPKPFWCTVCNQGFAQAFQLQFHLQIKHDSTPPNMSRIQPSNRDGTGHIDLASTSTAATNRNNNVANTPSSGSSVTVTNILNQASVAAAAAGISSNEVNQLNDQPMVGQQETCPVCGVTVSKDRLCPHVCNNIKQFQQAALTAAAAMAIAGERPHICSKCGKGFKTATHLKQHVRCVHSKERPHACQQCGKTFARMSDLNRHVRGVHDKNKSASSAGAAATPGTGTTAKTMRANFTKCTHCDEQFTEAVMLRRHIFNTHMNQPPTFKCADCQDGFSDSDAFNSHICHELERPHVCTVCNKRFPQLQQLRRHERSSHNHHGTPVQHICFDCPRKFQRPIDLDRHVKAVHLKEKPHKCSFCNKSFGLYGNLNKHIRAVHMQEKPHQCIECSKCFAHIGVLKRHLRDIHMYDKPGASRSNNKSNKTQNNNQQTNNTNRSSTSTDTTTVTNSNSFYVRKPTMESSHQQQAAVTFVFGDNGERGAMHHNSTINNDENDRTKLLKHIHDLRQQQRQQMLHQHQTQQQYNRA